MRRPSPRPSAPPDLRRLAAYDHAPRAGYALWYAAHGLSPDVLYRLMPTYLDRYVGPRAAEADYAVVLEHKGRVVGYATWAEHGDVMAVAQLATDSNTAARLLGNELARKAAQLRYAFACVQDALAMRAAQRAALLKTGHFRWDTRCGPSSLVHVTNLGLAVAAVDLRRRNPGRKVLPQPAGVKGDARARQRVHNHAVDLLRRHLE